MKKLLLALSVLLCLASQASAGCAWILWADVGDVKTATSTMTPIYGYDTLAACTTEANAKVALDKKNDTLGAGLIAFYRCFPDTLDPRGMKGK